MYALHFCALQLQSQCVSNACARQPDQDQTARNTALRPAGNQKWVNTAGEIGGLGATLVWADVHSSLWSVAHAIERMIESYYLACAAMLRDSAEMHLRDAIAVLRQSSSVAPVSSN